MLSWSLLSGNLTLTHEVSDVLREHRWCTRRWWLSAALAPSTSLSTVYDGTTAAYYKEAFVRLSGLHVFCT
jgi:hypothetical protein